MWPSAVEDCKLTLQTAKGTLWAWLILLVFQVPFLLLVAAYNFYDNKVSAFWKNMWLSTIPKAYKLFCIFCQVNNVMVSMLYFPVSALKKEKNTYLYLYDDDDDDFFLI